MQVVLVAGTLSHDGEREQGETILLAREMPHLFHTEHGEPEPPLRLPQTVTTSASASVVLGGVAGYAQVGSLSVKSET